MNHPGSHSTGGRILRVAFIYFLLVFGAGFALAFIRIPFLVPAFGTRVAELLEIPVMLAVIVLCSRKLACRNPELGRSGRLVAGLVALAMLVAAELAVAYTLGARSPGDYIASRDPVSGSVYLASLLFYGIALALWRPRSAAGRHLP